jgi:hypothetical protein
LLFPLLIFRDRIGAIEFDGFTGVQRAMAPHRCHSGFGMFYSSLSSDQTYASFGMLKKNPAFIISVMDLVLCPGNSLDKE